MNKTKVIGLMLLLALFVPTVSACHWEPPVVEEPEPIPEPVKIVKLRTTIRNSHLTFIWNGKSWMPNPNFTVTELNGRVYLTYE